MSIEHPEHRTDNLPSLDETAKVPVTHSDKVHGDENWSGVQETFHGTDARLDATQSDRVLTGQRTVEEELGERAKDRKGHMPLLAGVVTTALLVGGGIFGYNKATGSDKSGTAENPAPTPDTTATATTGEKPAETESYALSYEKYKSDPVALVKAYYEKSNAWTNAGLTPELANAEERYSMTAREYASQLAAGPDQAYISETLIPEWESNPRILKSINQGLEMHLDNLEIALITSNPENGDIEPYKRYQNVIEDSIVVESATDTEVVITSRWQGSDNSDKNRGEEVSTGVDPNTETGGSTMTFTVVNGLYLLSDIQ
jgi:hypothetical protein